MDEKGFKDLKQFVQSLQKPRYDKEINLKHFGDIYKSHDLCACF